MTSYDNGFHSYLFPADAIPGDDADWQQGWEDAREICEQARQKPTYTAKLTDDGRIDMFIIGTDGIPIARIKEPAASGEEAAVMAREWLATQEEETEIP